MMLRKLFFKCVLHPYRLPIAGCSGLQVYPNYLLHLICKFVCQGVQKISYQRYFMHKLVQNLFGEINGKVCSFSGLCFG